MDGSVVQIDDIIFCTGYEYDYTYSHISYSNKVSIVSVEMINMSLKNYWTKSITPQEFSFSSNKRPSSDALIPAALPFE